MHSAQEARPRTRSSFAAAALSLLFPGLGHAYAGAWSRALAFAAGPILFLALALGVVLRLDRFALAGIALQTWFLTAVFIGNLLLLVYRLVAIVDAWRVARYLNAIEGTDVRRRSAAARILGPLSAGGLLAVILVMAGGHVAVARYDLLASSVADCVFDPAGNADCGATAPTSSGDLVGSPGTSLASPGPDTSAIPAGTAPPWNGKDRLNILLVGMDTEPGGDCYSLTDTMIVASIDPTTSRVALFSLPRDTINVPLANGLVYANKINSLWSARANLASGCNPARGFNALKSALGTLYGLRIQYYVAVHFDGFRKIVDALGGVTINVQVPVVDDRYPAGNGQFQRVFIPTGIQHMSGAQALIYARSRHGSTDFDRAARQQRVLISLREQMDISTVLPHVTDLMDALKSTFRTDIPRDQVLSLMGLADKVDTKAIQSYVFNPPLYETEDYVPGVHDFLYPRAGLIRSAVTTAFTIDPNFEAEREKVAEEGATVWVLNAAGRTGEATDVAGFLEYQGINATAPNVKLKTTLPTTQIVVYNGAETKLTATIRRLQVLLGVTVVTKIDASVHVDIIVTLGRATPDLTPPPIP